MCERSREKGANEVRLYILCMFNGPVKRLAALRFKLLIFPLKEAKHPKLEFNVINFYVKTVTVTVFISRAPKDTRIYQNRCSVDGKPHFCLK